MERLEEIIDRLDSGQAGLRETLDLCREGRELVNYCAAELDAVGEGLKELRLDELAAKLESPRRARPLGLPAGPEHRRPRAGQPRHSDQLRRALSGDRELAAPIWAMTAARRSRPAPSRGGPSRAIAGSSGRSRKT